MPGAQRARAPRRACAPSGRPVGVRQEPPVAPRDRLASDTQKRRARRAGARFDPRLVHRRRSKRRGPRRSSAAEKDRRSAADLPRRARPAASLARAGTPARPARRRTPRPARGASARGRRRRRARGAVPGDRGRTRFVGRPRCSSGASCRYSPRVRSSSEGARSPVADGERRGRGHRRLWRPGGAGDAQSDAAAITIAWRTRRSYASHARRRYHDSARTVSPSAGRAGSPAPRRGAPPARSSAGSASASSRSASSTLPSPGPGFIASSLIKIAAVHLEVAHVDSCRPLGDDLARTWVLQRRERRPGPRSQSTPLGAHVGLVEEVEIVDELTVPTRRIQRRTAASGPVARSSGTGGRCRTGATMRCLLVVREAEAVAADRLRRSRRRLRSCS